MGFIVEGNGEFNCYPSLIHRITDTYGYPLAIINSGGCGGIYRNLKKYLTNIVITRKPIDIFITIDYLDLLELGIVTNCEELVSHLQSQINDWLNSDVKTDRRISHPPERILSIIQIQQFESWLLSDIASLINSGYIERIFDTNLDTPEEFTYNVDEKIQKPASFLKQHKTTEKDIKNTKYARSLICCLNPQIMKDNSGSFNKFYREVLFSYSKWCEDCGYVQIEDPN